MCGIVRFHDLLLLTLCSCVSAVCSAVCKSVAGCVIEEVAAVAVGVPVSSIWHLGLPDVPSPHGMGEEAGNCAAGDEAELGSVVVVGVVVVVLVLVVPSGLVVVVVHATDTGLLASDDASLFGDTVQLVCCVVVPLEVVVVVDGPVTLPSEGLTICAGKACVDGSPNAAS